jgi:hypothetical protein
MVIGEVPMAIYKLEVEKKYGQFQFRLYPQGEPPGDPVAAKDMKGLIEALGAALEPLDTKNRTDSVIFRHVAYATKQELKETVRMSRF